MTCSATVIDATDARRDVAARRHVLETTYAAAWQTMIRQWQAPRNTEAVWLMYAANYLFNSAGLRWAVDPFRAGVRLPGMEPVNAAHDLGRLQVALLTHAHSDHVDIELWQHLQDSACHWVVPEHLRETFFDQAGMPRTRCTIARPGEQITLAGMRILPFAAPHYERWPDGRVSMVPETGYEVQTASATYLLPGDIRTYEPGALSAFSQGATLFAHVFLGRRAALDPCPPLLQQAVHFYLGCKPAQILLTHLYDLARAPEDCWRTIHANLLKEAMAQTGWQAPITVPEWFTECRVTPDAPR